MYRAIILGEIWWPMGVPCSLERDFQADDDDAAIDAAFTTEAGDFSSVTDALVLRRDSCSHGFRGWVTVKDWANEDNELAYLDTLPEES